MQLNAFILTQAHKRVHTHSGDTQEKTKQVWFMQLGLPLLCCPQMRSPDGVPSFPGCIYAATVLGTHAQSARSNAISITKHRPVKDQFAKEENYSTTRGKHAHRMISCTYSSWERTQTGKKLGQPRIQTRACVPSLSLNHFAIFIKSCTLYLALHVYS